MQMENQRIKIAIVDDHALFRKGLMSIVREIEEVEVLFEADNGKMMTEMIVKGKVPDVILMDIKMPVMDGYLSTQWLKEHYPGIRVLALSMYEDDRAVMQMIKSGAGGYILKSSKPNELLEAVKGIHSKGVFINEKVSGKLYRNALNSVDPVLTVNELLFLKLCCSEMTYKEIAEELCISPRTIDNYRDSLFEKLEIKSRTGLVLYAIKQGIFELS